jgi:glycosyltransferase involved in cell wall biosynthesis
MEKLTPGHHGTRSVHVLHVVEAAVGGLRRHVLDLMQGLHAIGVEQALVYSPGRADEGWWDGVRWCEKAGIRVFALNMSRQISLASDLPAGAGLFRILWSIRPKILHLHSSKAGGLGRLVAVLTPGVKVVYTPNASPAHLSRWYVALEWILGRLRTDRLIAVSLSEASFLRSLKCVREDHIVTIESGVDVKEIEEQSRAALPVPIQGDKLVVASGRLSFQKNPGFVAEVSQLVLEQEPDTRFVWVGDGELRHQFEEMLRGLGVEGAWTITGWLRNPLPIVRRAHVFVLASRYEGNGYVTLEAMLLERPVVATQAVGTVDFVIPDRTGILVAQGQTEEFARGILDLLRTPDRAAAMGRRAREHAQQFSRSRMAEGTAALYRQLGVGVT